mmetsp:Transcript_4729/g.9059  ORF Transcript_4729/g.9059 Transcript_4729/m.9059 type:complete len:832 (+) Transcript_4729:280-2775(+)|eukprot:scaffold1499_cov170-Amphora_coffeaeformis.AAC.10
MLNTLPPHLSLGEKDRLSNDDGDPDANSDDVIVILDDKFGNGLSPPTSSSSTSPQKTPSLTESHSRNTSINSNLDQNTLLSSDSQPSTGTPGGFQYSDSSFLPYTPRHSDFTIPTSNRGLLDKGKISINSPPHEEQEEMQENNDAELSRRSIFGNAVQRKYKTDLRTDEESKWEQGMELNPHEDDLLFHKAPQDAVAEIPRDSHIVPVPYLRHHSRQHDNFVSDVSLPDFHDHKPGPWHRFYNYVSSCWSSSPLHSRRKSSDLIARDGLVHREKSIRKRPHETIHAQSLLLGLAFCAVWSANNVMAPNLTEMADFFGLNGAAQRDLYLGSYCALATGVFSFPIAAGIGVLADLMSRQRLFCITVAGGGISALITARAKTYPVLFVARLVNGGFMAGSTPVAFSFLGDLFSVEERNAASSGLTAMMGLGIIMGQVYAGMQGPNVSWQHAFYVSGFLALFFALLCLILVQEPERGGKEKVLQDMIRAGTRYDRKLTWSGFVHAVRHNQSNTILLWQGFFSSLPWGVIFVFLNDYLSQERGFSVPAATYLVLLFGLGCAAGGVLGGYWGQVVQGYNRTYLPIFMSLTTLLGILPFACLLNTHFTRAHSPIGILLALSSGLIASLPSVNVRPCLINVNPPETRGASLTAANLLISLGRGIGPSCVTLMGSIFQADRRFSINVTLSLFWIVSSIQLAMLAKTLPKDQDGMEAELASYAKAVMDKCAPPPISPHFGVNTHVEDHDDNESIEVSIEDRMTYFDGTAARQTLLYVKEGMEEFRQSLNLSALTCGGIPESSEDEESPRPSPHASMLLDGNNSPWEGTEQKHPSESTPLIV